MRVFRGFSRSVPHPTCVAVGNFDGVHLGHAALLECLVAAARAQGLPATVLTFEPHPREFFAPDAAPARLSTLREKVERLADCGIDQVMVCRFNSAFAALTAEDFVQRVLVNSLQARQVFVGDDFRFGQGRQGDCRFLEQAGQDHGFTVTALPGVLLQGGRVSSSGVRSALAAGDMDYAARLLGRPYEMDGRVIRGRQLGRTLGFPTANIRVQHDPVPMTGVFAVEISGLGERVYGVANLGVRPTVGGTLRPLLEVHLFDFEKEIYGAHLSVRFVHQLRAERKFPSFDDLQAQIARDAAQARAFFNL